MNLICGQLAEFEELLRGGLEGVKVIRAYPAQEKPHPLTRPIITLDIHKVSSESRCFGDAAGEDEKELLTGRAFKAVLCVTVHTPFGKGGDGCREVMDAALECLIKSGRIGGFSCGELKAAKERGAYVLSATVGLCGAAVTGSFEGIKSVSVKKIGAIGVSGEKICRELSVFLNAQAARGVLLPQGALRLAQAFFQRKKESGEILSFRPPEIAALSDGAFEITADFTEFEKNRLNVTVQWGAIL